MADSSVVARPAEPRRFRELSLVKKVEFWGFASLAVAAIAFYIWWGVFFGVWIDNGVYAVFITLLLFGLAGMWLVLPNRPVTSPPPG